MIGERFKADTGEAIYRRSLYTYWKRGMPPPQMTILNAPIRDACIARRERTNTPSQALLLLNESEYVKAARSLAQNVLARNIKRKQQVELVYEIVTSKLPDKAEQAVLLKLVEDLQKRYGGNPTLAEEICSGITLKNAEEKGHLAAWTMLISAVYNLDITKTRE